MNDNNDLNNLIIELFHHFLVSGISINEAYYLIFQNTSIPKLLDDLDKNAVFLFQ